MEINKTSSLAQTGDPKDLFAFRIGYNTVGVSNDHQVTPLFNGNISETYWLTAGDDRLRKYGYQYDNLNRLTSAVYMRPVTAEAIGSYDEAIGYDKNGNITSLSRTGYLDSDSGETYGIDDLGYKYKANSNELTEVIDHSNSLDGFRDRVNPDDPSKPDYFYDANGNMITDWNKLISGITYNHLNLPVRIAFKVDVVGQQYIEYIYNALGVKVGKRVYVDLPGDGFEDRTDYLGGFQYLDTVLQFFPTAEGYVNVAGSAFNYVYNYTDHLGNVRVSYTRDPVSGNLKILEENHYYPFGMKHSNYNNTHLDYIENPDGTGYADIAPVLVNKFKYKYNGKELQDELSLNWYDYGARNYDPAIGRWMNIDPLAEQYRRWSPYNYCIDNPMRFIDPDGMGVDDVIITGKESKAAFAELQKSVQGQLDLSMDTNGKVTYTAVEGAAINADSQQLVNAIDDHSAKVNITAENTYTTPNNELMVGGAFRGNTVTKSGTSTSVVAEQLINPKVLNAVSTDYNKPGAETLHEVTEAYQGALLSQASGVSSPQAGAKGSVYPTAHNMATPQSGGINQIIYDANGNVLKPINTGNGFPNNAAKLDYKTTNGLLF